MEPEETYGKVCIDDTVTFHYPDRSRDVVWFAAGAVIGAIVCAMVMCLRLARLG